MTRRTLVLLLVLTVTAGASLAHGGKSHRLLGTVKAVEEQKLVITTREGREATVALTPETRYERDGNPATHADLRQGLRVSLQLTEDDRTATVVKIAPAAPK